MTLATTGHGFCRIFSCALLVAAAAALAGCQTTGSGAPAVAAAPSATADTSASPLLQPAPASPQQPMTHTQAALQCWMETEHGHADLPLEKRADIVDKCIQQKMKGSAASPKG